MDSFDQAWELICDYCRSKITEVAFKTWFSRLKPVSLDFTDGVAILEAPNELDVYKRQHPDNKFIRVDFPALGLPAITVFKPSR